MSFEKRVMRTVIGGLVAVLVILTMAPASEAATRKATTGSFSMSAGAGLFVAADSDLYADISADLYPELGFQMGMSLVRVGLKAGLVYRKVEVWGYDYWGSYYDEYTRSFIPLQLEVLIAPLDMGDTLPMISPYLGIMGGTFLSAGDDDFSIPAFSFKAGADLNVDPLFIYGDLRYTHASHDGDNYGGVMVVVGSGLRFSF